MEIPPNIDIDILYPEVSDYMGTIAGGYNYDEKCEDTEVGF